MFSRLREFEICQLMDFIRDMCCFLAKDKEAKGEKLPNDENRIRTILLEEYIKKSSGMDDYIFLAETPVNYVGDGKYKGRADLCVLIKTDYSYQNSEAFFIAECKRLDGNRTLNKQYVNEGIKRFITDNPKYSSHYGTSMMIGFVIKPIKIKENARRIEGIQNKSDIISMRGSWTDKDKTERTERYECVYRNRSKPITLQHLFADFSRIIREYESFSVKTDY